MPPPARSCRLPLVHDNYFVPREYAIVQPDLIGTNKSNDCVHVGGAYEVACAKAVVYGLRGRAQAHTTIARTGASAPASWSSGKVGMV